MQNLVYCKSTKVSTCSNSWVSLANLNTETLSVLTQFHGDSSQREESYSSTMTFFILVNGWPRMRCISSTYSLCGIYCFAHICFVRVLPVCIGYMVRESTLLPTDWYLIKYVDKGKLSHGTHQDLAYPTRSRDLDHHQGKDNNSIHLCGYE
jgi:hypothetical protein